MAKSLKSAQANQTPHSSTINIMLGLLLLLGLVGLAILLHAAMGLVM